MITVLAFNGKTAYDITHRISNLSRSDSLESLAQEVRFDYLYNRWDRYSLDLLPEPGDRIQLYSDEELIIEGILDDSLDGFGGIVSFSAFDNGILLNRSEVDIQFNDTSTDKAIRDLCKKYGVKVDCTDIATPVTKNYFGEPLGDVLKNLLGMATFTSGQKYRLEVLGDTVIIKKYEDMKTKAIYKPASNLAPFDATLEPGKPSVSVSLADTYNAIKVVKEGHEDEQVIKEVEDKDSIARTGRRQKVVKAANAEEADKVLEEARRPKRTISITLLNDDAVRSGRILEFNHPDFKGEYLVTKCEHSYTSAGATMRLDLADPKALDAAVEAVDPNASKVESSEGEGGFASGDGIGTGQYAWPLPGVRCAMTTYAGHTNNARDFPVSEGAAVAAADGGVVDWVQHWDGYTRWGNQSYGNCVRIQHGGGRYTLYAHMSRLAASQGMRVSKGQTIGYVGNTGNSFGAHLHMEIVHGGVGIDPINVF